MTCINPETALPARLQATQFRSLSQEAEMNRTAFALVITALAAGPSLAADMARIDWSAIPTTNVQLFYPGQVS